MRQVRNGKGYGNRKVNGAVEERIRDCGFWNYNALSKPTLYQPEMGEMGCSAVACVNLSRLRLFNAHQTAHYLAKPTHRSIPILPSSRNIAAAGVEPVFSRSALVRLAFDAAGYIHRFPYWEIPT